jgi:amino acid adenylation domain-containing protein
MAHLLHQLLTRTTALASEREAVRFEGHCLTYGDLDAHSNQLAHALRAAGVRPGDRVGILLHKSAASVVAVFGIMKAGAVYVPLDVNAPAKRLAYITRNCDIKVLASCGDVSGLRSLLSEDTPATAVVFMDDRDTDAIPPGVRVIAWSDVLRENRGPVRSAGAIETDLAYILYTSGSTGEPKGVMISHRAVLTFVNWCCDTFRITRSDRVTSHAPLHFDLSSFDIYATVAVGGTLVLVPECLSVFPEQLTDLLQNERITVTYLVPSVLSLLVTYGKLEGHDLSPLRAVLFAGEVFPIKYLRQLAHAVPHADYYNLYGPTETNVCTFYKVQPHDRDEGRTQSVPIGVACENTDVFAVDDRQQRVTAPGQEGELWVRGPGLARGYWGDPEKTARTFVDNPFQPHFREVVYKTGDIVTLGEDSTNWRYVGRHDHMVKSRGYRIELGEIEAALYSNAKVKEAAAVAVPADLVGSRIKAFVVPNGEGDLTTQELEAHCRRILPRYMLPDVIEFRVGLPKTSSGKVDRQLLAAATPLESSQ